MSATRWRIWAIYVGAMLGPFGAGLVAPMVPELRESFGASTSAVGLGITVYHFVFAGCLLVSGTIGERFGRRRVVQLFFGLFAVSSILATLAPTLALFLGARALQGMANAFVTPLLIAGLAELTPPDQLGRSLGIYSSFQGAGTFLAPSVAGLAADVDWRLAFIANAVLATALIPWAPPGEPRANAAAPPMRPLLTPRMGLLALVGITSTTGALGIGYLVSIHSRDVLGLSATRAGLLLASAGLVTLALGPTLGTFVDRIGGASAGIAAAVLGGVLVALIGQVTSVGRLVPIWLAAAAATALGLVAVQALATVAVPENRGGAVSAVLSFRFAGYAISPLIWLPIHAGSPGAAFAGAGALMVLTVVALSALTRLDSPRQPVIADADV